MDSIQKDGRNNCSIFNEMCKGALEGASVGAVLVAGTVARAVQMAFHEIKDETSGNEKISLPSNPPPSHPLSFGVYALVMIGGFATLGAVAGGINGCRKITSES